MGGLRERANQSRLSLILPGDPLTQTGGYIYDRHVVEGLREIGWQVDVIPLDSSFPQPTPAARLQASAVLRSIPDGRIVVIDGLALGCLDAEIKPEAERLRIVALVHHPLALETGLDPVRARLLRLSERNALASVRRVVVTSRWTSRALAAYGVPPERIRVVEPGIAAPEVPPRQEPAAVETLQLLCVATLTPRKGHAVLVNALAQLKDRKWRLRCVGSLTRDAATAAEVAQQIDQLGLKSRVELLGEVDVAMLERCYADSDVFVLASFLEGYGMVLADAIAHGLPVISTLAGAIPQTVPAGAGILVPAGNTDALKEALATVMDEPKTRERLARTAQKAAKSLPSWRDAASRFAAALADLGEASG